MEIPKQQTDTIEFDNYLCIRGDGPDINGVKWAMQFDPQNIVGDDYVSMDNKIFSFERFAGTPLHMLAIGGSGQSKAEAEKLIAETRKLRWGTPSDAYNVKEHECDSNTLMFKFNTVGAPPTLLFEEICENFNLEFNLSYFSREGRVCGTAIYEQCYPTENFRFEEDGYDAVMMHFLAEGISIYDVSSDLFIEYADGERFQCYVAYIGDRQIEVH